MVRHSHLGELNDQHIPTLGKIQGDSHKAFDWHRQVPGSPAVRNRGDNLADSREVSPSVMQGGRKTCLWIILVVLGNMVWDRGKHPCDDTPMGRAPRGSGVGGVASG